MDRLPKVDKAGMQIDIKRLYEHLFYASSFINVAKQLGFVD
jgi:hypothetical protein